MKRINKNIAVIGVVSLLMCLGVANLNAQKNIHSKKDCSKGMEFSDQQKEKIKESKVEFAKATKDLKNELNELRAHQKTLMSAEKPDTKVIYTNIDKATDLKNKLRKEQIAMELDVRSVLTDDQKRMMANCPMRNMGMRQAGKGRLENGQARICGNAVCFNNGFGKGEGRGCGNRNEFGRKGMQQDCPNSNWMNLSDEQKVQMQVLRVAHMKESKSLRDEAEELQLKQKHMMTSENIDEKLIMANIDRLSVIQKAEFKARVGQ